jgi:outer membrane lipoprotein SlyB
MSRFLTTFCVMFLALSLGACAGAGGGGYQAPEEVRQGVIEQITPVQIDSDKKLGVGAIVGGIAGAGIGSLFGAGTGKDLMIAAGAISGAVGGQYMENKYDKPKPGQQIVVRLSSGVLVVVTQPEDPSLQPGQRVYVEGSGQSAKVVPR